MEKILHKYIIINKGESDWIDVTNLTIKQVQDISIKLDNEYGNQWYLKVKRLKD